MPLNYSGSKKAFGENVSKEVHAGKPQKQALAIAFSAKRKGGPKKEESMGDYAARRNKELRRK